MKNKVIKFLFIGITICLSSVVFLNSNVNANSDINLENITKISVAIAEGGSGNQATCYSTYTTPGILGGGTNIWRCGSCVSLLAKTFSDPGTCTF